MPLCDATNKSLEIKLDAAGSPELDVTVSYQVESVTPGFVVANDRHDVNVTTNGTTPVTIMPAPASGFKHRLLDLFVVQTNSADRIITINYNVGGTRYLLKKYTLSEGDNLEYS